MTDDLHAALTEINGIADARADEILDVIDEHGDAPDGDVRELVDTAWEYHAAGQHEYAAKFVRKARDQLAD